MTVALSWRVLNLCAIWLKFNFVRNQTLMELWSQNFAHCVTMALSWRVLKLTEIWWRITAKNNANWIWIAKEKKLRIVALKPICYLHFEVGVGGGGATWDIHLTETHKPKSRHDDVIKWKYFSRYYPFVRGIHRSPVNSTHKGQWRGALTFSLIRAWISNSHDAGDLRRHCAHFDVTVMTEP